MRNLIKTILWWKGSSFDPGLPVFISTKTGALTATGIAPTVTATAHKTVNSNQGALSYAGLSPVVDVSSDEEANASISYSSGLFTASFTPLSNETTKQPTIEEVDILGIIEVGQTVTAEITGHMNGSYTEGTHEYQWYTINQWLDGTLTEIVGATNQTYLIQEGDLNKYLTVKARFVQVEGSNNKSDWMYSDISEIVVAEGTNADDGDIGYEWADFFNIESGLSVPANWNDPGVSPILTNFGTGADWTASSTSKPAFATDKLVFADNHRIDGYSEAFPPVYELWVKARFTGAGSLLCHGNNNILGTDASNNYRITGMAAQPGDQVEHVFRVVMNGANSKFQVDGGPVVFFDEASTSGATLVMGMQNSGGSKGDFEIKRFQRTPNGQHLTTQEVIDKWAFHGFTYDGQDETPGDGDIDYAWEDFFDIENGLSAASDWNTATNPSLTNLGDGSDWTTFDVDKPTLSTDKLVFANGHKVTGVSATHPPVYEVWIKGRFTGAGSVFCQGNQTILGAAADNDYQVTGMPDQAGDQLEHVFRIVMNGAESKFQVDGGDVIIFDESTTSGATLVLGMQNSGGSPGDFELKRFQRTPDGFVLTTQEVIDKWTFHGFDYDGSGESSEPQDIDHAWEDFFDIETGASIPANWNDVGVAPSLINLGTASNWSASSSTKPTFSTDKLVFANAHRVTGLSANHPPVYEIWFKGTVQGHGPIFSQGNNSMLGGASDGDFTAPGIADQPNDGLEHVVRVVYNGANSIFQVDGGTEVTFDESSSSGATMNLGSNNSGSSFGDFELKRFQRTADGVLLTSQEVADKWSYHGF